MRLTPFEKLIFATVTGSLAGATAAKCLSDGVGQAHRIQDAAMAQVQEWRTQVKADRMRRARAKRGQS